MAEGRKPRRRRSSSSSSSGSSSGGRRKGSSKASGSRKSTARSGGRKSTSGSRKSTARSGGRKSTSGKSTARSGARASKGRSSRTATSKRAAAEEHAAKTEQEALAHRGSGIGEHDLQPSNVDAMGKDKRRQVVGHSYGPSRRSQVMFFVIAASALAIIIGGYGFLISRFDQPADSYPAQAPWSAPEAQLTPTGNPAEPCTEPGGAGREAGAPC